MTTATKKPASGKPSKLNEAPKQEATPEPELRHPVPEHLDDAGRDLWSRIVGDLDGSWQFDERELALLEEAARTADEMAELSEALDREGRTVSGSRGQPVLHPAVGEIRQMRTLLLRLLGALELEDPIDAVGKSATPEQARKRKAASARWARERRRLH